MNFTATPFIDNTRKFACTYNYIIGKRELNYVESYTDADHRNDKIDETRYLCLQMNLENIVNNIQHLADKVNPMHYHQFQKQLEIMQAIKRSYEIGTPASELIAKICNRSETLYKLIPPKESKYYNYIKSRITALVLYCEIN